MFWISRFAGDENVYQELKRTDKTVTVKEAWKSPDGRWITVGPPITRKISTVGSGGIPYIMISVGEQALEEENA
jgi:hypothetical protein